jgi:hypothetical protein
MNAVALKFKGRIEEWRRAEVTTKENISNKFERLKVGEAFHLRQERWFV